MFLATAQDAATLMAPLLADRSCEGLAVAYIGPERRLIDVERTEGSSDSVGLPVREIIAAALRRDASGLIVAHNHPSGDPSPSEADLAATRRLREAAAAVDIRLHDHLIFAPGECRSLRALGLL